MAAYQIVNQCICEKTRSV